MQVLWGKSYFLEYAMRRLVLHNVLMIVCKNYHWLFVRSLLVYSHERQFSRITWCLITWHVEFSSIMKMIQHSFQLIWWKFDKIHWWNPFCDKLWQWKNFGVCGHDVVKYTYVVYGAQLMTLTIRISGGHWGIFEDPILLFPRLIRRRDWW